MTQTLRVTCVSTLFPNEVQPRHGIFLRHRLRHLAHSGGIELRMVAPVPWFPSTHAMFGQYAAYARVPPRSCQEGIETLHPRYPVLPKIGMTMIPTLMAAALLPTLLTLRRDGFDFDVIDAYYVYPDGVAAALLGKILGRPVVLTALGSDISLLSLYALARTQIRWALARADGITTVCQALKDRMVALDVPTDNVQVIPHGVDLDHFRPLPDRAMQRHLLGFDRPTLISVGHLIARKRNQLALEALAELPCIDLVIAGDGPEEAALRRLATRRGVADRVRFLGHVDQRRLPALMGAADALLLCSDREGIANVIMESMACGTPVAATPVWGSPEVVNCPEAGVLFRDCGVAAVVEGIRRLLASPPDRYATRRYAERFTWSATAARHAAVLRDVAVRPTELRPPAVMRTS